MSRSSNFAGAQFVRRIIFVNAEINGEIEAYVSAQYVTQVYLEEYLSDLSSWFVEQRRDVLIVVGHGIRTNS